MTITLKTFASTIAIAVGSNLNVATVCGQQPVAPAPSADASDVGPVIETNPAVRAALELPREEPADYFQAIGWLIDLGRPELAKPILDELAQLQITSAQRAALVQKFGSQRMLQIARTEELSPGGAEFSEVCMAAAAAAANDSQRIAQLVAQLTDTSAEVRALARNDLAAVGQAGVAATLEAAARQPDPQRRELLLTAAAQMNPLVVRPLIAMLSTDDQALRVDVAELLQYFAAPQAVPLLPLDSASAELALVRAIERYAAGTPPFAPDENGRIELWFWDDSAKRLASERYPLEEARIIWAARLARALARIRPDVRAHQRQAWLFGLEAAGLTGSRQDLRSVADGQLVNEVLSDALTNNFAHAAVAAAEELGRRGDAGVLYTADAQTSPLANALVHVNSRVRFAALRAIMAVNPSAPFPGSSRVPEVLAWFALASGEHGALVAMPTNLAATDLAGMLIAHGMQAEATNRGRDAVDMALQTPDLEMFFVDMNILVPDVRQVVYELRTHPTTGEIPVALLAGEGRLEAAQQLAGEHDRVLAVPRVHDADTLVRVVDELRRLAGRDAVPPEHRAEQAVQAMTWLAQLLATEQSIYDLYRVEPAVRAALYSPNAAGLAIAALSSLNTADSQRTLLNYASQNTLPIESRTQAAEAFRAAVAANELLLTTDEILTQYNRYNASETADAPTQQVLGHLLDTIESRRAASRPATTAAP